MNIAARTNHIDDRFAHEIRLGNCLYTHPWPGECSARMRQACYRYVLRRSATKSESLHEVLARINRPVELPFAGRVGSAAELLGVLRGQGSIREEQCAIWRVFSNLIAEDLVGVRRRADVFEVAERSGFNLNELQAWLGDATRHALAKYGCSLNLGCMDPRLDFLRMDWHPIRQLQYESRVVHSSLHQERRYWSLRSRAEHEGLGGTFSRFERVLTSPRGAHFLPWMDTRRFFKPNLESQIVRQATEAGIPMITGASGVGMHTHQFARVLGIDDVIGVRLVAVAYLLPILQHSIYEVWISERSTAPASVKPFAYSDILPVDCVILDKDLSLDR